MKQPKEETERTVTLLTCLGVDALKIGHGLNFANEKLEMFCVSKTNETCQNYQFNMQDQDSGKYTVSYATALHTLAK